MSIVLRVNKGSALTYDEMDRNQSQFYFSSSLHQDGSQLRLHYTGSVALADGGVDYSPRYDTVPISTGDIDIPQAVAAGNNTEIQFNDNDAFGADSLFIFEKTKNYLGLGTAVPQGRLHIVADSTYGAETILQGLSANIGSQAAQAAIHIKEGSNSIGKIGRTKTDIANYDLFVQNEYILPGRQQYGKIRFAIKGQTGNEHNTVGTFSFDANTAKLGVGLNAINPARNISVVGDDGIGFSKTTDYSLASYIKPLPSGTSINSVQPAGSNRGAGLLISSPNTLEGGNVVLAINTDANELEGFNIIKSSNGVYSNSEVIASFQASGKVGINTNTPSDEGLTVDGIISGSGNLNVEGTATVETINDGSAIGTNKSLIADSNGLIKYLPAAPVPFGGIIMWSGNTDAVPEGWVLCNLNSSVTTDLGTRYVPDLTNKFIIGWNGDEEASGPKTDITGTDTVSGGNKNAIVVEHDHGGFTGNGGAHRHQYKDTIFSEESGNANNSGYIDNVDLIHTGGSNRQNSTDTNGSNVHSYSINRNTEYESSHQHAINPAGVSGTNKNLPPYYALAFIMYVGV